MSRLVEGPKGEEGGEGGGETGRCRVVGEGGARNAEGSQPSPVAAINIHRWEAGFGCENGGGGRVKVVGDPSADSVPEEVHRRGSAVVGYQEIGSVGKDGEEMAHGDPVGQKGASDTPRGGEAFYEGEGSIG